MCFCKCNSEKHTIERRYTMKFSKRKYYVFIRYRVKDVNREAKGTGSNPNEKERIILIIRQLIRVN